MQFPPISSFPQLSHTLRAGQEVRGSPWLSSGHTQSPRSPQSSFGMVPLTLLSRGEGSPERSCHRSRASPGVTRCLLVPVLHLAWSFGLSGPWEGTLIGCPLPKGCRRCGQGCWDTQQGQVVRQVLPLSSSWTSSSSCPTALISPLSRSAAAPEPALSSPLARGHAQSVTSHAPAPVAPRGCPGG